MKKETVISSPEKQKRKRRVVTTEEVIDDEREDLETTDEVAAEGDDVARTEEDKKLEEFQGMFSGRQYKIRIDRMNPTTHEFEWVDRVPLDGFDPFLLSKKFGGGRYRCIFLNDKGQYVQGGRAEYSFAQSVEPDKVASPPNQETNLVQVMLESQKQQTAMLMEILKGFMGAGAAQQSKQSDITQLISALKSLKDMEPSREKDDTLKQLDAMLGFQLKMRDLTDGGDRDRGASGGGGLMSDIKDALKLLVESRNVVLPPARPQTRPAPTPGAMPIIQRPPNVGAAAAGGAAPGGMSPGETKESETDMPDYPAPIKRMLAYVPIFVEAAQEKGDLDHWAGFLVSVLSTQFVPGTVKQYHGLVDEDGVWERLIDAAGKPELVEKIFVYAPALADHREWVLAVIHTAVLMETNEGSDDEPQETKPVDAVTILDAPHENGEEQ